MATESRTYAEVEFPHETCFNENGGKVRLYGCMGQRVFGVHYGVLNDGTEYMSQALAWDIDGKFGEGHGSYPSMDLAPPTATIVERAAQFLISMDAAQERLNSCPDAPAEWRRTDERVIENGNKSLAKMAERKGVDLDELIGMARVVNFEGRIAA